MARVLGNEIRLYGAFNDLAEVNRAGGDLDAAERLYDECLVFYRRQKDIINISLILLNLARLRIGRGFAERVPATLREALAIVSGTGSKQLGLLVLDVSTGLAALRGQWPFAARLYGTSQELVAATGLHRDPADDEFLSPLVAHAHEVLGEAAFSDMESHGRALSYDEAMVQVHAWLQGMTGK